MKAQRVELTVRRIVVHGAVAAARGDLNAALAQAIRGEIDEAFANAAPGEAPLRTQVEAAVARAVRITLAPAGAREDRGFEEATR